jgi:hypothetical protein
MIETRIERAGVRITRRVHACPVRTCGGQKRGRHIHSSDNDKHESNVQRSSPIGQPEVGRSSRIERTVAIAAGAFSVVVFAAILASAPNTEPFTVPEPTQAQPAPERGDPALGQQLAEQAQQAAGSDPQATLRLLLAAHVVAPDRATHRIALAQAMLGAITPVKLVEAKLDAGGSITYAALSSDASFLVTSGAVGDGQVWQTGSTTGPARVRLAGNLNGTVTAAAAAGRLTRTNLLTAGDGGVSAWRAVAPISPVSFGTIAARADAVAVSGDATTAVTVEGTTATIWDVGILAPVAKATLPYDVPVTALAFSPGAGLVLAAGQADGGVTVHTINLSTSGTSKRSLAAGVGGPVDAVALSADSTTVAAVHQDGTLSVWDLRAQAPQPSGRAGAAAGPGSHRIWLSATGDYGFVADGAAAPALWSLADRHAPARMLVLPIGDSPAVPAMISADGQMVAFIDRNERVTLWNIKSSVDALADPIGRACQISKMTEQRWRQLVPDTAFANPCATPAPPSLGVDGA